MRHKKGGFETHAHPAKPYFMRVSGLAKNPILSKTVQDCLRTEAAAACLDDSGLASKIEREARNLQTSTLYAAEGAQTKGGEIVICSITDSTRRSPC